jgi:acyl-CoA thioester hydrolase
MVSEDGLISVEQDIKAEFYDVDAMGVVWHGNYARFLELGRCALLDAIGYGYRQMVETGYVFPVVSMNIKYLKSLTFGDTARIRATLTEWENCMKIRYLIFDPKTKQKFCKAESTQMAVRIATKESCFACPKVFLDKVAAYKEGKKA